MTSDSDVSAGIVGCWQPARSSQSLASVMMVHAGTIAVLDEKGGETRVSAPFGRLDISSRVGNIPRRITFPDGSVFETGDNERVDALLRARHGRLSGWVHRAERFRPRLIGFVIGAVLLLAGLYRYGLPVLVDIAVAVTPPVVPELMSSGTLKSLDETILHKSTIDDGTRAALQDGLDALIEAGGLERADYRLHFRGGGLLGPNAFALPDGTLIVTDELVEMADGDLEMLVGVLGHEIAHVEYEHSLRQFYQAMGVAGLILLIGGDVGEGVEDILVEGGGLLSLSFSRAAESEADRRSVELMAAAGRDPAAIGRFFKMIETALGDTGGTSYFSTHPGTVGRREVVERLAEQIKTTGALPPR